MKTIYLDSNFICHADYATGRTSVETDILDGFCDNALPCYRFIPAVGEKVDFCQCIDSKTASAIQKQYDEDSELMNIIDGTTPIESEAEE